MPHVGLDEETPPATATKIFTKAPVQAQRDTPEMGRMRDWYRGYQLGAKAATGAIRTYLEQRQGGLPEARRLACEASDRETGRLLADRFILLAPDPEVETALRATYGHFQSAAQHCLAGADEAEEQSLAAAQAAMVQASELLGRYGLAP